MSLPLPCDFQILRKPHPRAARKLITKFSILSMEDISLSLKIADIANSAATAAAAAALGISPTLSKKGHQLLFIVLLVNSLLFFKFVIFPFTIANPYPVYLFNDLPFSPFLYTFLCISRPSFHTSLLCFFFYLSSFFFSSFFFSFFLFFYLSSFLLFQTNFIPNAYFFFIFFSIPSGPKPTSAKKIVLPTSLSTGPSNVPDHPPFDDSNTILVDRWIIQPYSTVQMKIRFRSENEGKSEAALAFEVVGTGQSVTLLCQVFYHIKLYSLLLCNRKCFFPMNIFLFLFFFLNFYYNYTYLFLFYS